LYRTPVYVYSGHVAGAVLGRIALPRKLLFSACGIIRGVSRRRYSRGGAWRTPLGDARIDEALAEALEKSLPAACEDSVAHSASILWKCKVPFLQALAPDFTFVPVALGRCDSNPW